MFDVESILLIENGEEYRGFLQTTQLCRDYQVQVELSCILKYIDIPSFLSLSLKEREGREGGRWKEGKGKGKGERERDGEREEEREREREGARERELSWPHSYLWWMRECEVISKVHQV